MLIINARVLTMSGADIEKGFVEIEDAKIKAVGSMDELAAIPSDVLDLGGKYLLPGFVDAHSHMGMCEDGVGYEGDDINECSDPVTPHLRALDAINPIARDVAEAREGGVTCVVAAPGSANPIGGQICAFKPLGRWIDRMLVAEPLAMKFAFGENPKREYGAKDRAPMSRMASVAMIREALLKARHYMHSVELAEENEEEPPELDFKSEALIPLLRGEIRAHMHAHRASDILCALRIAEEFGFECTIVHGTEAHLIADILAGKKVRVICGPVLGTRSKPELSNMELYNAASLIEQGMEAAVCTDHPEVPAQLLATSAAVVCAEGLGEREGLLSITLWAAKAVGLEHRVGSIEPGKDADLVVFAEHPLRSYRKPEMVFIDGEQVV